MNLKHTKQIKVSSFILKTTRISLLPLLILFFSSCVKKETLSLAGSETMHEMVLQLTNQFMKENSSYIVDVRGGGSQLGIDALEAGIVDIALVSRPLLPTEKDTLNSSNNLEEIVVAYDGAAIIVHPDNPMEEIDLDTASRIFSGKVSTWKEINGVDESIETVIRNKNSGTGMYFKEHVVRKKDLGVSFYDNSIEFSPTSIVVEDNLELIKKIASSPGGISYVGMGYANESNGRIKVLKYKKKKEDEAFLPTISNLISRKYKIARGLYLVYKSNNKKSIDDFISFATGERGQKLIIKSGYLRSSLDEVEVIENK